MPISFHVGLHKTGTTFLQLALRRALESEEQNSLFLCQHSTDPTWKAYRSTDLERLKRAAYKLSSTAVRRSLKRRQLEAFDEIRKMSVESFSDIVANSSIRIFHSDENTLGRPPGHVRDERIPIHLGFYPAAVEIMTALLKGAKLHHEEVRVVLTIRDFVSLAESSYKDYCMTKRPVLLPDFFFRYFHHCNSILSELVDCVAHLLDPAGSLHILNFDILRKSEGQYIAEYFDAMGLDAPVPKLTGLARNKGISTSELLTILPTSLRLAEAIGNSFSLQEAVSADRLERMRSDYRVFVGRLRLKAGRSRNIVLRGFECETTQNNAAAVALAAR